MLKATILLSAVYISAVSAFCKNDTGSWGYGAAKGVSDFATAGVAPNDKYYCWVACSNTYMVSQHFKIKLGNPQALARRLLSYEEAPTESITAEGDDSCVDPFLRAEVDAALLKVTNHSASAIARTLQYQIGRPDWIYTVVETTSGWMSIDSLYSDMNFCLIFARLGQRRYDIHMVAIDMS